MTQLPTVEAFDLGEVLLLPFLLLFDLGSQLIPDLLQSTAEGIDLFSLFHLI